MTDDDAERERAFWRGYPAPPFDWTEPDTGDPLSRGCPWEREEQG